MSTIQKQTLHPINQPDVDTYPKTSVDQVVGVNDGEPSLQEVLEGIDNSIKDVESSVDDVETQVQGVSSGLSIANGDINELRASVSGKQNKIGAISASNNNSTVVGVYANGIVAHQDLYITNETLDLSELQGRISLGIPLVAGANIEFEPGNGNKLVRVKSAQPSGIEVLSIESVYEAETGIYSIQGSGALTTTDTSSDVNVVVKLPIVGEGVDISVVDNKIKLTATGGGSKLYQHKITIGSYGVGAILRIIFVNNKSTAYDVETFGHAANEDYIPRIGVLETINNYPAGLGTVGMNVSNSDIMLQLYKADGSIIQGALVSDLEDVVTEV